MRLLKAALFALSMLALPLFAGTLMLSGARHYSPAPGGGEALFTDDFSSGDISHTENGISWTTSGTVTVETQAACSSGQGLQFPFNTPSPGDWAEQRFNLGALYTELWIKYDWIVPANYAHPDGPTTDNNKFFRLWSGDTSDGNGGYSAYYLKQGFSLRPDAGTGPESELIHEFGHCLSGACAGGGELTGVGRFSSELMSQFVDSADYGTEVEIVIHLKVDTSGNGTNPPADTGGNGISQIWKNGVRVGNETAIANTPLVGTNGWNRGYLMGAPNADYQGGEEVVTFFVCDFVIAESNIFGVPE